MEVWEVRECGRGEVWECGSAGGAGVWRYGSMGVWRGGRNGRPVQLIIKCQGRKGEFGLPVRRVIISAPMSSENLLTALRESPPQVEAFLLCSIIRASVSRAKSHADFRC